MGVACFFQLCELRGFTGERRLKFSGFLLQRFNTRGLLRAGRALLALRVLQAAGEAIVFLRQRAVVFQQLRVLRLKRCGRAEAFFLLLRCFELFFQPGDFLLEIVYLAREAERVCGRLVGSGKSIGFTSIC